MNVRGQIWREFLDAAMNVRFYQELTQRRILHQRCVLLGSGVATSVAAVNLVTEHWGKTATIVLAVVATALNTFSATWSLKDEAFETQRLYDRWLTLTSKWEALWRAVANSASEDPSVQARFEELEKEGLTLQQQGVKFSDPALVNKIMPKVEKVYGAQYGASKTTP